MIKVINIDYTNSGELENRLNEFEQSGYEFIQVAQVRNTKLVTKPHLKTAMVIFKKCENEKTEI